MKIMKKYLFLAAAIALMVGCADDNYVGDNGIETPVSGEVTPITFGTGLKAVTRAEFTGEKAADKLNNNFVFLGTKTVSSTRSTVFDHYNANWITNTANTTQSNSNDWEYVGYTPATTTGLPAGATQAIKYWDYTATQYDFAAYSLGKGVGATPTYATASALDFSKLGAAVSSATPVYTLTGKVAELKECYISDLVTAYNYTDGTNSANTFGQVVTFSFRSLASKIRMAFYETIPGYSVKDLQFYNLVGSTGTTSITPSLLTADDAASLPAQDLDGTGSNQSIEVYFPTTGFSSSPNGTSPATDYNKAHVKFSSSGKSSNLTFDALGDFAGTDMMESAANYLGRTSNTATYAGGLVDGSGKYYTILPNETGVNLMIRVKYTLVSTDGSGEVINVDNATAVIPLELASWKPNYAYTYIFKISDMTNGTTGVDKTTNTPVMGLTPITLNAVVVESEDGIQETITTVTDPSITTYMAGKVVTDNDEYKKDGTHPIYIVVNNGTDNVSLTPGTNAQLYTAEITAGAGATGSAINVITEESVDNALRYGVLESGKTVATSSTFTVTDANKWNLVLTKVGTTATDKLTAETSIPAAESPTGDAVALTCAAFVPTAPASGTKYYVFQYKGNTSTGAYGTYTAVAPAELATSGTTYYTESGGVYTEVASVASGTKVVSGGTVYYTKGADIYEAVTGALTAGKYYYYDPTNASANADGYVSYVYASGDAPAVTGGYYTKKDNYIRVPYAKLTANTTYYTSDRGAGAFVAKGTEDVDAENKYFTQTSAEVDAEYMYKIIKVVP